VDIIQDNAIHINGNNIVNNSELNLSFLIKLYGTTTINTISYTDLEKRFLNFIATNNFKNYETPIMYY